MKGIADEFMYLIIAIILAIVAILFIMLFYESDMFKGIMTGLSDAIAPLFGGGGASGTWSK
jgi:hypothetical protein